MILFLDFDGVLHPHFVRPGDQFESWPRLEAVLIEHAHVEIVVSSSWRTIPAAEWDQEVPESLRRRVVGRTPVISRPLRARYPLDYEPEPIRFWEIQRYLKTTRQASRPWVALDDDETVFPPACPNLILCRDGFGDDEERRLRAALQEVLP